MKDVGTYGDGATMFSIAMAQMLVNDLGYCYAEHKLEKIIVDAEYFQSNLGLELGNWHARDVLPIIYVGPAYARWRLSTARTMQLQLRVACLENHL